METLTGEFPKVDREGGSQGSGSANLSPSAWNSSWMRRHGQGPPGRGCASTGGRRMGGGVCRSERGCTRVGEGILPAYEGGHRAEELLSHPRLSGKAWMELSWDVGALGLSACRLS